MCVLVRCVCILGIILVYCLSLCDAHSMFTRKKDELEQRQRSLGRKLTAELRYWSVAITVPTASKAGGKQNLDNARDLSGVSSQQDPGIGRFANQKRRT